MPDLSEILARRQELAKQRGGDGVPPGVAPEAWATHLRGAHTVAAQMAELVKGTDWETYTAHIGRLKTDAEQMASGLERDMAAGSSVGDELVRQKLEARYFRGYLAGLDAVLALPQHLIDQNARLQPPPVPTDPATT